MWVDIDVGQILGGRPEKSKKVQRRLSTKNPRMVAKYNKAWKEKLRSEGWDLELDQIQKEAEKTGWSHKLGRGRSSLPMRRTRRVRSIKFSVVTYLTSRLNH